MPARSLDTAHPLAMPPDPGQAVTLEELVEQLRSLKVWAGDPAYETIKDRINVAWRAAGRPASELARKTTVVDCFRRGRRRLNAELAVAVVEALHPDVGYVAQWRQALRVVSGETQAASQVRVLDRLPQDLAEFTGRGAELDRLRRALHGAQDAGEAVVISAIEGMAGVGKTQLAIRAGHLMAQEEGFDRVLFVNLRGFHPDAAQPPADPLAVLDGFLRVLGMPGHQIPHDLEARTAAYRERLVDSRTLVVLDNAADPDQVRPLLPETAGCFGLVTSRRSLAGLERSIHLTVDVFTAQESIEFLLRRAPHVAVGPDAEAAARIARRCGHLPLALGLVTAHMASTPGWTLTDHADRLDEHYAGQRLGGEVEIALTISYDHLSTDEQRLLRTVALHPGQDFDAHAAAALTGTDLLAARTRLGLLCRDHLLQQADGDRYTLHDLVRVFAANRAGDEDRPSERRAALTRLFDYYVATAVIAMDALSPADAHRRPRGEPPTTPIPTIADAEEARRWLDTERPTLVSVAQHTATGGWTSHATRLSSTLFRYLNSGPPADGLSIHGHALHAAEQAGDRPGQVHALNALALTYLPLGHFGPAAEHLTRALRLYRRVDDPAGQARTLGNLGLVELNRGNYRSAAGHHAHALRLFRQLGDLAGEAYANLNLGVGEERLGNYRSAAEHHEHALRLFRQLGDLGGEATALTDLGIVHRRCGEYNAAEKHLQLALALFRRVGHRAGEGWTLDNLGTLSNCLDQPDRAADCHRQALAIYREIGDRPGVAAAFNGLGEAARTAGGAVAAIAFHTDALDAAGRIGDRCEEARAHGGLGSAHEVLGDRVHARLHYRHALALYTDLDLPQAAEVRDRLSKVVDTAGGPDASAD